MIFQIFLLTLLSAKMADCDFEPISENKLQFGTKLSEKSIGENYYEENLNIWKNGTFCSANQHINQQTKNGVKDESKRWYKVGSDRYAVLVVIDKTYDNRQVDIIKRALLEIQDYTCMLFYMYDNVTSVPQGYGFVHVKKINGCSSHVGRFSNSEQDLSLVDLCVAPGTVQHEFIHSIGFQHEHEREDRDRNINIHYDNFAKIPGCIGEMPKWGEPYYTTYGAPYDTKSVMHYSDTFCSKDGVAKTLTKKDGSGIPWNHHMTYWDTWKINQMYPCSK